MVSIDLKNILARMATQRVSVSELARRTGMSRQATSAILKRGRCSIINAGKIAAALGFDVAEILKEV